MKRLETFPNFNKMIKKNSFGKEFLKFKKNLEIKINYSLKENLELLCLEGPEIERILQSKIENLYFQC